MEDNLEQQIAMMEKYDPDNHVALIADEWGNWHDAEPGTNPGFLYQQNTLRDALTAGIYLNVFNNHCYRVKMANIAQTVNVLQAMVLTKDKELVKTPTFYVFKLYKVHQDALQIPAEVQCENYTYENDSIPALSVSASKNKEGFINVSVVNTNPNKDINAVIKIDNNSKFRVEKAEVITAKAMDSLNDFGKEEQVNIKSFSGYKLKGNEIHVVLPSKSIVQLMLKQD